MPVTLNGEPTRIRAGSTLSDLLDGLGRHPHTVAIEHNGAIVRRDEYSSVRLEDGERVEIVHFVQGG